MEVAQTTSSQTNGAAAPAPTNTPQQTTSSTTPGGASSSNGASPETSPQEWYGSFSNAELKGYVQNKQFKSAEAVVESYRHLEKLNGSPDKLIKIPEGEDPAAWEQVYNRLGKPEKADHYQLDLGENAEQTKSFLEDLFYKNNLSTKQGREISAKYREYLNAQAQEIQAQAEAQTTQQIDNLRKEWGAAHEKNVQLAEAVAQELGITGEKYQAFERALGVDGAFKMLHSMAEKLGEDKYISGGQARGFNGVLTPEQAQAQIKARQIDKDFAKRYVEGDAEARAEMARLHKYAYPE